VRKKSFCIKLTQVHLLTIYVKASAIIWHFMQEQGGEGPPELPEAGSIIEGLAKEFGIEPRSEPQWGYSPPVEQMFHDEADTLFTRRQAIHCLGRLYYYLDGHLGAQSDNQAHITPHDLISTYESIRQEQRLDFEPDYELPHVLGAAKRHIRWLKERRVYDETLDHDHELAIHQGIHDVLEEIVYPEEIRTIHQIEEQIHRFIRQTYPITLPVPSTSHANSLYQRQPTVRTAPHLEEYFPHYLNIETIKFLPEEADTFQARNIAAWCCEHLVQQVVEAREARRPITPEQIKDHYLWYLRVGQRKWNEGGMIIDFTLENLLGQAKRHLLGRRYIKDQRPDYHQSYRDTLTVYDLIVQALN
jgi:hypothetical protein